MADDNRQSLSDLADLTAAQPAAAPPPTPGAEGDEAPPAPPVRTGPEAVLREQQLDAQGRAYATGRRKDAVARVWIKPGSGKILINDRSVEVYFARPVLRMILAQPLQIAQRDGQYDIVVNVNGGGLSGQAGAVRHGLAKALTYYEPELRGPLKKEGFLTRDPRVVERKKYGRKKARRSFQFSKR